MSELPRLLVICGPSGSGKSVLEQGLVNNIFNVDGSHILFKKLIQVTTRKPRQNEVYGNPYIFVSDEEFERIRPDLIGRVGLSENTIFDSKYGTIVDTNRNSKLIYTAIFAEEAISDLIENAFHRYDIFILGINGDDSMLLHSRREGRDLEFINKERTVLNKANLVLTNKIGNYLDPEKVVQIMNILEPNFFLRE